MMKLGKFEVILGLLLLSFCSGKIDGRAAAAQRSTPVKKCVGWETTTFTISLRRRPAPPPPTPAEEPAAETSAAIVLSLFGYDIDASRLRKLWLSLRWPWPKGDVTGALTPKQIGILQDLRRQIDEDDEKMNLSKRGAAVGFEMSDAQLIRFLRTSNWKMNFPDGNTVRQSVINTVTWRETCGIWRLVTERQKREALLPIISTMFAADSVDTLGHPKIFVKPALVADLPQSAISKLPDAMLYSLERAERAALREGIQNSAVLIYLDCRNCSLAVLKRYVRAVMPIR